MTKKDFQVIAAVIAALSDAGGCQNSDESDTLRAEVARVFADALAATNPRFKRDLFIQAATGQVAVTARKAKPQGRAIVKATRQGGAVSDTTRYLIWSTRKHAWYGSNCAGYAPHVQYAGRYAQCDVGGIITGALPGQLIPVVESLALSALSELQGNAVTARLDSYRNY